MILLVYRSRLLAVKLFSYAFLFTDSDQRKYNEIVPYDGVSVSLYWNRWSQLPRGLYDFDLYNRYI